MLLLEETFADPTKFTSNWLTAPGMSVAGNVLTFAPEHGNGYCVGVTRRGGFRDVSVTSDVCIVRSAIGFVLRASGPHEYYMIQFDLKNDPSSVWFHTFTKMEECGYRLELVPSPHVPRESDWHTMRV